MANIELVIKIAEEVRVAITRMGLLRIPDEMQKKVDRAIQRGTPLPKGHGRLIDESDLMPDSDYEDGMFYAVSIGQINDALTIIPADKEEKDANSD